MTRRTGSSTRRTRIPVSGHSSASPRRNIPGAIAAHRAAATIIAYAASVRESRLVVSTPPAGRLAVESAYRFERVDRMHRMAVEVASFQPRVAHTITRLGPDELEDVIDLYGHASRTYFTPDRMAREIYFGIYAGTTLMSAAGTHVRSKRAGLAPM